MTNNKKAAIVYGVLAVLSIFNMAEAYNYYCQVWLIGEKGIAAFSTADFSVSKGMSESDVGSRILTSKDPLVGELATQIEKEVPGRVMSVNKEVYREDGSILTDLDIELDNMVIQVKAGGGNKLTQQLIDSENSTGKTAIGYAPKIKPSVLKEATRNGFKVFTNIEDLIDYISKN